MPRLSEKTRLRKDLDEYFSIEVLGSLLSDSNPGYDLPHVPSSLADVQWQYPGVTPLPEPSKMYSAEEVGTAHIFPSDVDELLQFCNFLFPFARYIAPRQPQPHREDFWSYIVHAISEDRFESFFRMGRESFKALCQLLRSDPIFQNNSRCPQADVSIQLATALYRFGHTGGSTVTMAEQFGLGEGTIQLFFTRVTIALLNLTPKFLRWPEPHTEEYRELRRGCEESSGFPGCVGFLDGTDIVLRNAPSKHSETYFGRKKVYGFNMQAVCDSNRKFIFVSTGYPLCVSDATAFGETSLCRFPNKFFAAPEEYILADKIYRCTRRCMPLYKEPKASQVSGGYAEFNKRHARARVKIENAFGVLINRWASLRGLPLYINCARDHSKAVAWAVAAVVLNNILKDWEDDSEWIPEEIEKRQGEGGEMEIDEELTQDQERKAGQEWRDRMRLYFTE